MIRDRRVTVEIGANTHRKAERGWMYPFRTLVLTAFILAFPLTGVVQAAIPPSEREALLALYNATDGANWTDNANWLGAPGTECNWSGVACDAAESVVIRLELSANGLKGKIPAQLGDLSSLTVLYLYSNQLSGTIPVELGLGTLSSLEVLNLASNQLSGLIPVELGNLTSLGWLILDGNALSGSIPVQLGSLSSLRQLNLHSNQLSGSVPLELGNLSSLSWLTLHGNQLSGEIPAELSALNLHHLELDHNALTAPDPAAQAWADTYNPNWAITQTVAPADLAVIGETETTTTLSWTPIEFTAYEGGYEIQKSSSISGPWVTVATTASKLDSSAVIDGTADGAYFRARTITYPHGYNANTVVSDFDSYNAGEGGCSVACSAIVPTSGGVDEVLEFSASSSAVNCSGSPSYHWSFGDGTSSSSPVSQTSFSTPGTYHWTLTVTQDGQTCQRTGSITITDESTAFTSVALGDSYSSGEGAGDYYPGTNVSENRCHRSRVAFSQLDTLERVTGLAAFGRTFLACSGATTQKLYSHNDATHGFEGPQLERYSSADLTTVSIGGNDAHFASILKICAIYPDCGNRDFEDGTTVRELLNEVTLDLEPRLIEVYRSIREKSPDGSVFAIGYPQFFPDSEGNPNCRELELGEGALWFSFYEWSEAEQAMIRQAAAQFDVMLRSAASQAGVHYIPVSGTGAYGSFQGHEICGPKESWFVPFRELASAFWRFGNEAFHPNELGHQGLADALAEYVVEQRHTGKPLLPSGIPENPSPQPVSSTQYQALVAPTPTLGELFVSPNSTPCGVMGRYHAGTELSVTGEGFAPNTAVEISLTTNTSFSLGSLTATADGVVSGAVLLPSEIQSAALLEAEGQGANGGPRLLVQLIEILPPAQDADSDGVEDLCDNCPTTSNPAQTDADGDSLGDECDTCPFDADNDLDDDGVCGDVDACPLDPLNDFDGDGVCGEIDICPTTPNPGQEWIAGDSNRNCSVDVGDVFYLINHLFAGGPLPAPAADANGTVNVDVSDVFYLINHLFAGGPVPVAP